MLRHSLPGDSVLQSYNKALRYCFESPAPIQHGFRRLRRLGHRHPHFSPSSFTITVNTYIAACRSFERTEHRDTPSKFSITAFRSTWSIVVTLHQPVDFIRPSAANHTMSYALVQYCPSRLPMQHIERLGDLKIPFELHAVPFQFLQNHHSAFGFDWVERLVWRTHELHKPYNFLRPELLLAQKSDSQRLVTTLTIIPRKDYIRHYVSMLEVA